MCHSVLLALSDVTTTFCLFVCLRVVCADAFQFDREMLMHMMKEEQDALHQLLEKYREKLLAIGVRVRRPVWIMTAFVYLLAYHLLFYYTSISIHQESLHNHSSTSRNKLFPFLSH